MSEDVRGTRSNPCRSADDQRSAEKWIGAANLQTGGELLLGALRDPTGLPQLSLGEWERLIPLAKFTGLWPQLASRVRLLRAESLVPAPIQPHLHSVLRVAEAHEERIRWELNRLHVALAEVRCPVIVLKGTAFLLSGFAFAQGRRFQDIDILVPRDRLETVEAALRTHGWVLRDEKPLHAQYYRTWLHELAPMWHPIRKVLLDVHYTIIPPKDRIPFDPEPLFQQAKPLGAGALSVLAPADMFLHASTNLFRTGEFTYLLRDLWDMHQLVVEFAQEPGFWDALVQRAVELRLERSCSYALRYLQEICHTPVPPRVADRAQSWGPPSFFSAVVDAAVRRCLFPRTLDRLDHDRDRILALREYWPPPRLRAVCSFLFWRKRLPADPLAVFFRNAARTAVERGDA